MKYLIFAVATLLSVSVVAQETPTKPLTFVEKMPSFPSGDKALQAYLSKNIKYPQPMMLAQIEGVVVSQFVVEADGSVSNIKILRSVHPAGDAEVIRVLQAMPTWQPGVNQGVAVPVHFNLPVTFDLPKQKERVVHTFVDEMPAFKGGEDSLHQRIRKSIRYPQAMREQGIEGTVVLKLLIEADGRVSDIVVVRETGGGGAEEAVRFAKTLPPFIPARLNGESVASYYNLPITFQLGGKPKKEKKKRG